MKKFIPVILIFILFSCQNSPQPERKISFGRPKTADGTVLSSEGTLLRGPYWSIDLDGLLPDRESVSEMKDFGMNSLHVYVERHDSGVPAGSYVEKMDTLVQWCGEENIYCVMTIGCGSHNGMFDPEFARKFWNTYAPRYKDMPWVIYEVHNEPFSWEPPYDKATLAMEQEMYDLIRGYAPDTMILMLSYASLSTTEYLLQDINQLDVDWSNAAVAFHSYGGFTEDNLKSMKAAGINSICTELSIASAHYSNEQVNAGNVDLCEIQGISWLDFIQIKPGYLGSWRFKEEIDARNLGWTPDFGSWPAGPSRYVPPKNLALGKSVSVSSAENFKGTNLNGVYATDGDAGTRWSSKFADNQFIIVDLGETTEFRKIVIHWESQYAVDYDVQVSDDKKEWKTLVSLKNRDGGGMYGYERLPISAEARYIRLYLKKRRREYGFSIYEIEVYGAE